MYWELSIGDCGLDYALEYVKGIRGLWIGLCIEFSFVLAGWLHFLCISYSRLIISFSIPIHFLFIFHAFLLISHSFLFISYPSPIHFSSFYFQGVIKNSDQ